MMKMELIDFNPKTTLEFPFNAAFFNMSLAYLGWKAVKIVTNEYKIVKKNLLEAHVWYFANVVRTHCSSHSEQNNAFIFMFVSVRCSVA